MGQSFATSRRKLAYIGPDVDDGLHGQPKSLEIVERVEAMHFLTPIPAYPANVLYRILYLVPYCG
jgi:hypothetical protein